jgi:RNA polymerase sigma-70 factor, ECF subfamily
MITPTGGARPDMAIDQTAGRPAPPPDPGDFEALTLEWLPHVRRYALRLTGDPADADDLVQTTYLNAFTGWHTFRPGSDARRWLFAICRNAFLRARRRESRFVTADDAALDALAAARAVTGDEGRAALEALDRVDLPEAIDAAIAGLPEPYRLAVLMVDVEGLSYEEAAREGDVPVGTVRSRLFRGRRLLQEELVQQARDAGILRRSS